MKNVPYICRIRQSFLQISKLNKSQRRDLRETSVSYSSACPGLTPLELQSRLGGKALKFQVICPQLSPNRDCSPKRVKKRGVGYRPKPRLLSLLKVNENENENEKKKMSIAATFTARSGEMVRRKELDGHGGATRSCVYPFCWALSLLVLDTIDNARIGYDRLMMLRTGYDP